MWMAPDPLRDARVLTGPGLASPCWRMRTVLRAMTILAVLVCHSATLHAQGIELSPYYGYRFGGEFFELITGQEADLDGAPATGVVLDVPTRNGFQVEGVFTHQKGDVFLQPRPSGPLLRQVTVDHWLAGGLQEWNYGRIRPFLTGVLGFTRYAAEGDNEIRLAGAAGGGVKLFPSPRIGVRLDSRFFATLVDAEGSVFACTPGVCLISLHANLAWQAEFTAGLIIRFP